MQVQFWLRLVCMCVCVCFRPWKFEHMATDLLSLQLREDHPLPPDAVLYFTQSLIHDSLSIRKVCSCVCTCGVSVCLCGEKVKNEIFRWVVRADMGWLITLHAVHSEPHPLDSLRQKYFSAGYGLR